MKNGEETQQTHDRLMEIVNERRSYGDKVEDEEVSYKLLMSLRVWNSTLCTIIKEKEGIDKFSMDEVIGRILAHKNRDDEGKRVSVLIGDEGSSKEPISLKAKNVAKEEEANEDSDEEFALFI